MFLQKKRRRWPYFLLAIILLLTLGGVLAYRYVSCLTPEQLLTNPIVVKYLTLGQEQAAKALPDVLGFVKPKIYLVLFQNNTELRPAGGFIGVYVIVHLDKGAVNIQKVEGTEVLDKRTPSDWKPTPPKPISDHLTVDRWYFRDSNWSPDFAVAAQKALELYRGEGGAVADQIDAVLAITPTVLEELMKITGSFTIQGIPFTADTVTEKLEYEVEYGYDERGVAFSERKQIIEPFMRALVAHMRERLLNRFQDYLALGKRMASEGHILAYAADPALEAQIAAFGLDGRMKDVSGDYLWWVDANLAALKTDHAMKRTLAYSFAPAADGGYVATTTMTYINQGKFDWRTTRYRTYARVFIPLGSTLVRVDGSMKTDRSAEPGVVDQGEELGKHWFGAFIAIEPGQQKSLTFVYRLPTNITDQMKNGTYTLLVQKQHGTIAHSLTLDLNFGRTIQAAAPAEVETQRGNATYVYSGDLRVDRMFDVHF